MTMRILGIETSCDESGVAVIEVSGSHTKPRVRVLANVVASQVKLHAKFGGVVPNLAKREHQRNLVPVLLTALKEAGLLDKAKIKKKKVKIRTENQNTPSSIRHTLSAILEREPDLFARMIPRVTALPAPNIDAIAVTVGPGLAPALWVGVNFARALSCLWEKPLIAVNHLAGHIYTNLLPQIREVKSKKSKVKGSPYPITHPLIPFTFPTLCLIVSGGHTELVLMSAHGRYRVLGETLDDAAGEAFDKVAKMMRLGFPGGPIISRLAGSGDPKAFNFPRPMMSSANYDFSFSGLKTSVLYTLRDLKRISERTRRDIAASFEQAVVDVLVAKTVRAARQHGVRMVLIGGGVAANRKLRDELGRALKKTMPGVHYLLPDVRLTGDNALMIALVAYFHRNEKMTWRGLQADPSMRLGTVSLSNRANLRLG